MNSSNNLGDQKPFSYIFSTIAISCNVSKTGPVTLYSMPAQNFERNVIENLGPRAMLSAGFGEHYYQDRIFSARISLPKVKDHEYEALIFSFIVDEDEIEFSIRLNSQALALLIFIFPRKYRKITNEFEDDLEIVLKRSNLLPKKMSKLLDKKYMKKFLTGLRKFILSFEEQVLIRYKDIQLFDISKEDFDEVNLFSLFNDSTS